MDMAIFPKKLYLRTLRRSRQFEFILLSHVTKFYDSFDFYFQAFKNGETLLSPLAFQNLAAGQILPRGRGLHTSTMCVGKAAFQLPRENRFLS